MAEQQNEEAVIKLNQSSDSEATGAVPEAGAQQRFSLFFGPKGLWAKWRAMLFVIAMVLSLRVALLPINWLSSQGLLGSRVTWTMGVQWAAFLAAFDNPPRQNPKLRKLLLRKPVWEP